MTVDCTSGSVPVTSFKLPLFVVEIVLEMFDNDKNNPYKRSKTIPFPLEHLNSKLHSIYRKIC